MQTMTSNEAKTHFGQFIDAAQREPVRVLKHDREVAVLVSAQDYASMQAFYANRLLHTLAETGQYATSQGLTPEKLDALLADES